MSACAWSHDVAPLPTRSQLKGSVLLRCRSNPLYTVAIVVFSVLATFGAMILAPQEYIGSAGLCGAGGQAVTMPAGRSAPRPAYSRSAVFGRHPWSLESMAALDAWRAKIFEAMALLYREREFEEYGAGEGLAKPIVFVEPLRKKKLEYHEPFVRCPVGEIARLGADHDGGKFICNQFLPQAPAQCVVYSIGSNGQYDFEEAILKARGTRGPPEGVGPRRWPVSAEGWLHPSKGQTFLPLISLPVFCAGHGVRGAHL